MTQGLTQELNSGIAGIQWFCILCCSRDGLQGFKNMDWLETPVYCPISGMFNLFGSTVTIDKSVTVFSQAIFAALSFPVLVCAIAQVHGDGLLT